MSQSPYVYCFVRKDLSQEQILVQASHACIESALHYIPKDIEHPNLVVCGIPNESKLLKVAQNLDELGIKYRVFYEADDQATALATEPIFGEDRQHFRKYQLLKFTTPKVMV